MNNRLLMRMRHRIANLKKQQQSLLERQLVFVAELRDRAARDTLHHEIRSTHISGAGIKHLGDVRVIHPRQGLALRVKPCNDFARIETWLDQLQRDDPADGVTLLDLVNASKPTFANPPKN